MATNAQPDPVDAIYDRGSDAEVTTMDETNRIEVPAEVPAEVPDRAEALYRAGYLDGTGATARADAALAARLAEGSLPPFHPQSLAAYVAGRLDGERAAPADHRIAFVPLVDPGLSEQSRAVDRSLLFTFGWSTVEHPQNHLAAQSLIGALEQIGWTVARMTLPVAEPKGDIG